MPSRIGRARGGRLVLYLPLIVAIMAQAVFVLAMPSRPEVARGSGGIVDADGPSLARPDDAAGVLGSPERRSGSDPGTRNGTVGVGSDEDGTGQDTSHCRDGRQHDLYFHAPPCTPTFVGDNGGATAPGVSEGEILVVSFFEEVDEYSAVIYEAIGAADPLEVIWEFERAAVDFFNERHEFYGRKVRIEHVEADCPISPSDVDRCRAAARHVIRKEPFLVLYNTVFYPEVFDEFARAGIVTIGGSHFDASRYERWAGLRWDYLPDGTTAARLVGEYYCRRMGSRMASHAGELIHPSIGPRDATERKLGVIVQEDDTNYRTGQQLQRHVERCQSEPVTLVTYANDINTAAAQSAAITNRLIRDRVTTVACLCVTGLMTILSPNFTSQDYFPEHLLPGIQWLDNDVMARSFDPEQWRHAFGLSTFPQPRPYAEGEVQQVWNASGRQGFLKCNSCRFWIWQPMRLLGSLLQEAGPFLAPQTFATAARRLPPRGGWKQTGGDPFAELQVFEPGSYTAVSDFREVYWDPGAPSAYDGEAGSYVAVDGGRRHRFDQIPSGPLPFPRTE